MTTMTLRFSAIDPAALAHLRVLDDAGREPVRLTDSEGGAPLRCCLRGSRPGEEIALVSYAPLRRWAARASVDPGPYDERGPIYIHAGECGGPAVDGDAYPVGMHGPRRVFRAYSAQGHIVGGRLVEVDTDQAPAVAGAALAELLSRPEVAFVHARAVEYGCFLFEVARD